jgi:predicted  nucleic acid-binding Zn-ribbon protein
MDEMEIRVTNVIENTRNAPIVRDWVRKMLRARDEVKRLEQALADLHSENLRHNAELQKENAQLSDDAAQAIQYAVDVKTQMAEVRLDLDGWRTSTLALEKANAALVKRINENAQDEEATHGG